MAVSFVGASVATPSANPTTSQGVPNPSGLQAGDYVFAVAFCRGSTKTWSWGAYSTGTSLSAIANTDQYTANGGHIAAAGCFATSGDVSAGYTGAIGWSNSVSNATAGGVAIALRGVDTSTPVRNSATSVSGGASNTPDPPSVNLTSGDTVLCFYGKMDDDGGSRSAPTDYTLDGSAYWSSTAGTDGSSGIAYRIGVAASSENPGTFTTGSGGLSTYWYAGTVSIVPSSGGGTLLLPNSLFVGGGWF